MRLRADWRPLMGLTPDDAGTFVEKVLADVVVGAAVEAHNIDVERANKAAKSG